MSAKGFSLPALLITVAIIGILIAIAVPALNTSKAQAERHRAEALEKTLNDAVTRVRLKAKSQNQELPPALQGDDTEVAITWLIENGYIQ